MGVRMCKLQLFLSEQLIRSVPSRSAATPRHLSIFAWNQQVGTAGTHHCARSSRESQFRGATSAQHIGRLQCMSQQRINAQR